MQIQGTIKSFIFRNNQNGYTVLKLTLDSPKETITLTGIFPELTGSEKIIAEGSWVNHPRFGKQFAVTSFEIQTPETSDAMILYLQSRKFPGIGKKTAEALVNKFGNTLPEIIEKNPEKLKGVARGFGETAITKFLAAWFLAKEEREQYLSLYQYEIKGKTAEEIIKTYGKATPIFIKENPYFLCHSKFEISFFQIDPIALKNGFSPYAEERVTAALIESLRIATCDGHVFLPETELLQNSFRILNYSEIDDDAYELIKRTHHNLCLSETILSENSCSYLPKLYYAENFIAQFVNERTCREQKKLHKEALENLSQFEKEQGFSFDAIQKEGIFSALQNKFSILTGGPGTGKTTLLKGLLHLAELASEHVTLAAPTGRAAKRMKEVCKKEAYTIHRLLSLDPVTGNFIKNKDNPISATLLIIDEFSMVDTELCAALFQAIPWHCRVLLIGDSDQLPSVGPGNILKELLACKKIPQIKLNRVFRQKGDNDIAEKADSINKGILAEPIEGRNFHFLPYYSTEEGTFQLFTLIQTEIHKKMSLDLLQDLQILVPMRKGPFGTQQLNEKLREILNPQTKGIDINGVHFKIGDRVMQLQNNYDKNIFNGDIGFVSAIFPESKTLHVTFDDRTHLFTAEDISEITLAYASTIHKSQGSEYPAVIIILDSSHYRMLRRNLLYTAVTRAKGHVWILSAPGALSKSLVNQIDRHRYTNLKHAIENF